MRVLLIHPLHEKFRESAERHKRDADDREVCFPLGIGYIAAVLKAAGHAVTCWDIHAENLAWEQVQQKFRQFDFDVVGISAISSQYDYVKRLAELVRRTRNVPIIVGGALATFSSQVILKHTDADYCVLGEGEVTAVELLEKLDRPAEVAGIAYRDNGQVRLTPARPYIHDLAKLPMPAYELFDMEFYVTHGKKMQSFRQDVQTGNREVAVAKRFKHLRTGYLIGGRGCPYRCRFCSRNFQGMRIRPLEHLMAEIRLLKDSYECEFIHLGDELVTLNKKRTLELCAAMKRTGLLWDCQSRVNVIDEEMLAALKDSGCVTIGFGIESGSQRLLDAMKKDITVEQSERAMRAAMKLDFDIKVQLMFGFPGEDMSSLKETIGLFKRLRHAGRGMSFFTVFPGTEIYDFCVRSGVIPDEDAYLSELKYCSGERVLLNFTRFPDEEIYPRIKWARAIMRANACLDRPRRKSYRHTAQARLMESPAMSWWKRLAFKRAQEQRVRLITEELRRINAPGQRSCADGENE